jgi:hypothetical protein
MTRMPRIRTNEQEDCRAECGRLASSAWESGSVAGMESKWKGGRLWRAWRRFRQDVDDDRVDFFGAGDLDDAGEESLPRLGTWAAVDD